MPTRGAGAAGAGAGAGTAVAIIVVGTYGRDTDEVAPKPLKAAMTGEKRQ